MDTQWLQAVAKAADIELSAAEAAEVLPKVERAFSRRPSHEDWTAQVTARLLASASVGTCAARRRLASPAAAAGELPPARASPYRLICPPQHRRPAATCSGLNRPCRRWTS